MRARSTCVFSLAARESRLNSSQRSCQSCIDSSACASSAAEARSRSRAALRPGSSCSSSPRSSSICVWSRVRCRFASVAPCSAWSRSCRCRWRSSRPCWMRLLGARDLGADLVVAALDRVQRFGLLGEILARRLDGRFDGAQLGDQRLHRRVALAQDAFLRLRVLLDHAQAQCQQLGGELALFLLQRLVAARGRRLALQVAQLLVDFVAHVAADVRDFPWCARCELSVSRRRSLYLEMPAASSTKPRSSSGRASMTREIMPCSMMA